MIKKRFAVLVSGRGSNLAALIAACQQQRIQHDLACVICNEPQAQAINIAKQAGVSVYVLPHQSFESRALFETELIKILLHESVDLVVLAGFMRRLTNLFCQAYAGRIINTHPSLLPAFRGAHAIKDALSCGVKVTGVTIHMVTEVLDEGPILFQEAVPIEAQDTENTLRAKIQTIEHRLLPMAVQMMCDRLQF